MPLFMDRHDLSEVVTAENIAQLHQADLKIQSQYECKGLTYWFDGVRKTAFCLIEAPNAEAIRSMHKMAHGDVPHEVIEVDANIVESFLGRIEDPKKSQNLELNIINDPAFRCIMAIRFPVISINGSGFNQDDFKKQIIALIGKNNGSLVNQDFEGYLTSFTSVSNSILCSLQILSTYNEFLNKKTSPICALQIGMCTGVPVSKQSGFFEEAIQKSKRLCAINKFNIVVTTEVKELYESENLNTVIDPEKIYTLNSSETIFLDNLLEFIEKNFSNEKLNVNDFNKQLGYSKSYCYRKMNSLMGISPNNFLNEFRLNESLKLLKNQHSNVSEISYDIGFSSASYFSKCFTKRYGINPSDYKLRNNFN